MAPTYPIVEVMKQKEADQAGEGRGGERGERGIECVVRPPLLEGCGE